MQHLTIALIERLLITLILLVFAIIGAKLLSERVQTTLVMPTQSIERVKVSL